MNIMLIHRIAYALRDENVFSIISELKTLDTCSGDTVLNYKYKKLQEIMNYAIKNTKYYMSKNIRSININEFPISDKEIIRNNMRMFTDSGFRANKRSTSGTTGAPFIFPKDVNASAYMDAMMYHAYSWHDIKMNDKQARLWGRPLSFKGRLLQSIKDLLLNRIRLSAFEMKDSNCFKYFNKLLYFKPKYFYSYSSALYQFALFVDKYKLDGLSLGVKVAICTGEVLFDYQRGTIEKAFGCKVINEYGSTENGIIGFECEHRKMHIMPTVYLEIENPDQNGYGAIIVTELNSRSLLFLKYKNGDVGRLIDETCKCGRQYQLLEIREGRIDDYIICPDGSLVYDAILAYSLKNYASKFKAVQESIYRIDICLVPNSRYSKSSEDKIIHQLREYLGHEMNINFNLVEDIPPEKSGKLRYFVSKIK